MVSFRHLARAAPRVMMQKADIVLSFGVQPRRAGHPPVDKVALLRIQPRKQVLDIWRAVLHYSYDARAEEWTWGSGDDPNSVADAEQLLCLLHPMNEIETFALHEVKAESDVDLALRPSFRSRSRIPAAVVDICQGYFTRHTDKATGQPVFAGGSYLFPFDETQTTEVTDQQRQLEVVDAFSMSITLCLAVLAFTKTRKTMEHDVADLDRVKQLEAAASTRLTAAMVALIRCFVVNAMYRDDAGGIVMLESLGRSQPDVGTEVLVERFHERLKRTRARLRSNVSLGIPERSMPKEEQLFEIGWTWGVAKGAEPVKFIKGLAIAASEGVADTRPYLYFTVIALDGLVDLFSARVRELELFTTEQTRLVEALRVRWELTQRYWSAMARFDTDNWPLQDLPWRTSDGEESDYYSLLVTSVLIKDFDDRRPPQSDVAKAVTILKELAGRAKVTRRLTARDPAMALHWPGTRLRLIGSEHNGPLLAWHAYDFTPVLLKRSCQAMRLTLDAETREDLMRLAEKAMDQIDARRIEDGPQEGLWDDVAGIGAVGGSADTPSWYFTERIIEALVTAAQAYGEDSPRTEAMYDHLIGLLSEADHLYNQQLMVTDIGDTSKRRMELDVIDVLISQARALDRARSATAVALAQQALIKLNDLGQARADARRGG